ncbi:MAG: SpoIIE family protein phosphatase, partial [Acidobacteria bacterium]|nr:SpoIIE family protein phosphatase [Acidobacteriota bacterium]
VTEANNASHDLFEEHRLIAVLEKCAGGRPQEVCDKVVTAVQEFAGGAPQADDLTLMVLRYGPVPT